MHYYQRSSFSWLELHASSRELLRTYDIYLHASHDASLDLKWTIVSLLQKLDNKEQGFGVTSQAYLGDHFMTFLRVTISVPFGSLHLE